MIRKIIISVSMLFVSALACLAQNFTDEVLKYKVDYKWGLVHKVAGSVNMQLKNAPGRYDCTLTASSAGWADKFYMVRDTLMCQIVKDGFRPVYYEKRSHEGGDDKLETVTYSRSGNTVNAVCTRKKWEKGKLVTDDPRSLSAEGDTYDMLSAFYFMRTLPYDTWTKGKVLKANIFSGKRKELLTIKYVGKESVSYDKRTYDCYHIKFTFTSGGGKKSSDDIDAWISTSGRRIPVKLEGSLPIGKIRCFYTGQ